MTQIKRPEIEISLIGGIKAWRVWSLMGVQDIKQRYRNSALGPLWMLANLGVILGGVTVLYSELLHQKVETFMPFLAISIVLMNLIWPMILESCHAFAAYPDIIRQVRMPLSVLIMRTLVRNLIVTGHNLIIVIIVFIAFNRLPMIKPLELLLGIVLLLGNLSWMSVVFAIIGARFRDSFQITSSVLNFMSIFTPIYWVPELIKRNRIFLDINPLYHLIQVGRAPLLGGPIDPKSYIICAVMMVVGWMIAFFAYNATYKKIAFWV